VYQLFDSSPLLLIIGIVAGILGSLVGIGGGILISPALSLLGLAPSQVASTSLIAVSSTSISSTIAYARLRKIQYSIGLKLAIFSAPGAISGALISASISPLHFRLLFVLLLLATGLYLLFRNSVLRQRKFDSEPVWIKVLFYFGAFVAGLVSSIFGIGGGIIFVPLLVIIIRMNMSSAVPTSQLALMSTALVGTITHIIIGNPEYIYALLLSIGSFIGAQIGAKISARFNDSTLRYIFALLLMAVSIRFVLGVLLE
jgi:uncharacterized membrane protein YfcA